MSTILGFFKVYFSKLISKSNNSSEIKIPKDNYVELYLDDNKLMFMDSKGNSGELLKSNDR